MCFFIPLLIAVGKQSSSYTSSGIITLSIIFSNIKLPIWHICSSALLLSAVIFQTTQGQIQYFFFYLFFLEFLLVSLILLIKYSLLFHILVNFIEILTYSINLLAVSLFLSLNYVFTISLFINVRKSSED